MNCNATADFGYSRAQEPDDGQDRALTYSEGHFASLRYLEPQTLGLDALQNPKPVVARARSLGQ